MFWRAFVAAVASICFAGSVHAQDVQISRLSPQTKEILTDAAIIALVIAASIAAYKAMGKPCACPNDTMRNGRACGGNSAYLKPNGYKPLCNITDITPTMIAAYRATKQIPGIR